MPLIFFKDKSLQGWKEVEYEVVRDAYDNCITVRFFLSLNEFNWKEKTAKQILDQNSVS